MKTYKIIENRNNENYQFLIETDDELLVSPNFSPENGEEFFGSWTDSIEEFESDSSIELLVEKIKKNKITIKKALEDLEDFFDYFQEELSSWDSDEENSFILDGKMHFTIKNKKEYVKKLIDDYQFYLGDRWESWSRFLDHFEESLEESNDYWDEIEKIFVY